MSRDAPAFIDRIPGMVWFFAGMLSTSLVVGILLAVAHGDFFRAGGGALAPMHTVMPAPAAAPSPTHPCGPEAVRADPTGAIACDQSHTVLGMAETEPARAPTAAGAWVAPEPEPASPDNPNPGPTPEAPTPSAADLARAGRQGVRNTLQAWTRAWSSKDMPAYLAQYHADFVPADGMTRTRWAEQRHRRILGKDARITVFLREIDIELGGDTATATFTQDYDAGRYRDSARKRLTLARSRDQWLILSEESID